MRLKTLTPQTVTICFILLFSSTASALPAPQTSGVFARYAMPVIERLHAGDALAESLKLLVVQTSIFDQWLAPAEPIEWVMPHQAAWPTNDAGVPLVTGERMDEIWHTITHRRDLTWVLDRYKVKRTTLERWNPDVDLMGLAPGDELVTWRRESDTISHSKGTPNRGRLVHGEPLLPNEKYHIMHRHRAFGTYYITHTLQGLFDAYALRYPNARPVVIGDLSYRTGRRIKPHLSHQSGRDVDITYPRLDEPKNYRKFHRIRRNKLDAERTLWLVREMLATGYVERIFMDYWVQRAVYKEAERQGAPQLWLDAVFQYPKWGGEAFLQRAKGHDDHMHIRFFCQPTDERCRNR